MMNNVELFDQTSYRIRFEWGAERVRRLAPRSQVVVIVDVLSFTTCVDVAISRDAVVFPYRYKDEPAIEFAQSVGALLAGTRGQVPSLSPNSLLSVATHSRLVLPFLNGSTWTIIARESGVPVLAGCLRNAQTISEYIHRQYPSAAVTVIACGEQWPSGMLRPAIEDLIGAGAILSQFDPAELSPEAKMAAGAYEQVAAKLSTTVAECASGRELAAAGFPEDVARASELNVSRTVPIFEDGAYHQVQ
jgi:2-phosphosulfolactate phosphatase